MYKVVLQKEKPVIYDGFFCFLGLKERNVNRGERVKNGVSDIRISVEELFAS